MAIRMVFSYHIWIFLQATEALAQLSTLTVIPTISHLAEWHKFPGGSSFVVVVWLMYLIFPQLLFLFAFCF